MTDQMIPGEIIPGDENDNMLIGGAGPDVLNGEGGDDTLTGGLGDDTLNGGEGVDTAVYNDIAVPVEVTLNGAGVGTAVRETGFAVSVENANVASLTPGAPAALPARTGARRCWRLSTRALYSSSADADGSSPVSPAAVAGLPSAARARFWPAMRPSFASPQTFQTSEADPDSPKHGRGPLGVNQSSGWLSPSPRAWARA